MHPISSSRHHLNTTDTHGRAAYKLLALVPVSCDPPATPITPRRRPSSSMTPQVGRDFGCQKLHLLILQLSRRSPVHSPAVTSSQSYLAYLTDARAVIRTTARECSGWRRRYDGREGIVATDRIAGGGAEVAGDPLENEVLMGETTAVGPGSLEASSGYLSGSWSEGAAEEVLLSPEEEKEFWSAVGYSVDASPGPHGVAAVLARVRQEDRLSMSSLGSEEPSPRLLPPPPTEAGEEPTLGPFLTLLLEKVSTMPQHSLGTNLRLTALVSKLASFPHPLLQAVLLHPDLVVQPTCLTLTQVLQKYKILQEKKHLEQLYLIGNWHR